MSNFVSAVDLALNSFRISKESCEILARGVVLIGLKVFLFEVCIFLAWFAGIAMHVSSESVSCPMIAVWAMSETAYFAEAIRFRCASVEALSIERWENVRAIGLDKSCRK